MGDLTRFLKAKTGFEWGLCISGPILFVWGLVTGKTFLIRRPSRSTAALEDPWWFFGLMAFHALCCLALYVSLREWRRNRGRWFPEQ